MNYPTLPGLTPDGTIYFNPKQGVAEAKLPTGGFATAHAPTLLELNDGSLLCAWFAGSYEGAEDIGIVCARLDAGSGRWSEPSAISGDPERSEQNPSLFAGPNGEVWAMYTAQLGRQPGKDNMQFTAQIRCQKSLDGGRSWGAYSVVFPREGLFARQPIQVLSGGRWIFGNWICSDAADGLARDPSAVQFSDDQGRSWRQVMIPHSEGRVHPNVVELEPGHLKAFLRSRAADFIYVSESMDCGASWSQPRPTVLPNNNSGISALKLHSGRIAIAYNHASAPDALKNGSAWPGLRCPVSVALSEDGGETFPLIRNMEMGEGYAGEENRSSNHQYEYPCLIQGCNGMLHLAFAYNDRACIKWMSFREEDVIGRRRSIGVYNPTAAEFS